MYDFSCFDIEQHLLRRPRCKPIRQRTPLWPYININSLSANHDISHADEAESLYNSRFKFLMKKTFIQVQTCLNTVVFTLPGKDLYYCGIEWVNWAFELQNYENVILCVTELWYKSQQVLDKPFYRYESAVQLYRFTIVLQLVWRTLHSLTPSLLKHGPTLLFR